jgi:hypothetical protein
LLPILDPDPAEATIAVKDYQGPARHALISVGVGADRRDAIPFSIATGNRFTEVIELIQARGATFAECEDVY